jgi:hypothetical protein
MISSFQSGAKMSTALQLITKPADVSGSSQAEQELARLHTRRRSLLAEQERYGLMARRLADAERDLQEEKRELADIGQVEQSEMSAWAQGGGVGDMPQPLTARRRMNAQRTVGAEARSEAARGAAQSLNPDRERVAGEIRAIDVQIRLGAIAALEEIHAAETVAAQALFQEARRGMARLAAIRQILIEEGQRAGSDAEIAVPYFNAAERLGSKSVAEVFITVADVIQATPEWMKRLAELRAGGPVPVQVVAPSEPPTIRIA